MSKERTPIASLLELPTIEQRLTAVLEAIRP